jgi:RNA polymerase sigma factor (sigma-70 family)
VKSERPTEVEAGDVPVVRGESFESFYARQQRRLVGLAFSVSGSRLGAEDLVQDALAAAYRDWDRIQRLEDPEAWVRRILLNRAVSGYRRRVSELKALARLAGRREVGAFAGVSDDADHVWAEVRRLPKRQIQAVALRYVEDLTLDEIGQVLGCSKETVNTHLRRARTILGRRLRLEVEE